MSKVLVDKWNSIYQSASAMSAPAEVLVKNLFLLPKQGFALDLASGLGANALLLARQGLSVQAIDISTVALQRLQCEAEKQALPIATSVQDIESYSLPVQSYDVIVVSRFLDRSVCNAIMESLKPDGLLFYQTFTQNKVSDEGPRNSRFLLAEHELLHLFSALKLIYYRDNGCLGQLDQGLRNEALFIGQKI